ncbi:HAMP domain-containing histidine kinase [candidate division KSB1 bacterium]|nr:HAMP domain-containing histidine kinase [candidate division KSB1 bacterium]
MAISVRKTLYLLSGTLKSLFFAAMVIIVIGFLLYTQNLVNDLRMESRDIVELHAQTIQKIASDVEADEGLGWFFENIIQKTNFPLILADTQGNPTSWIGLKVPENDYTPETLGQVRKLMNRMARENDPVAITYQETVISYLYYGDSRLITRLIYLPYITVSALGLLIIGAFLGFSSIKSSEQSYIWVGMAKETAHQLGTPTSSLMGWIEMIKLHADQPSKVLTMAQDMESDVKRLEKVTARFSQIGSRTDLKKQELDPILVDLVRYFQRRLPQMGKETQIQLQLHPLPLLPINRDLLEWAIENLIKNALDAVKGLKGLIVIQTGPLPEKGKYYIDITDNGVGMPVKMRRDIFKAGFSTKKRGWGLGLNFTKRIIEEYHNGKVSIKESHPGKGTTMRIVLG